MASTVAATMGLVGNVVPVRNVSSLSSSSSFGSPLVNAAPLRPVARRNVMVTRAALPEVQSRMTARREMLASLIAAGAALATAGSSMAASGPGTPGAKRTNEKATDLLKEADKLTTEDSPPRFGPGTADGGDDTGRLAQKAGAGAVEELQNGTSAAIEGAETKIEGTFAERTGDISDASAIFDDVAGKVSSDIDSVKSKVSSDVSDTTGTGGSFVADAQSKIDSSTKDLIVGSIKDKIQEAISQ